MDRFLWEAHQDNGLTIYRWSLEGEENVPDPWTTRQFHLYTLTEPRTSVRLDIPRGAYFECQTHEQMIRAGWRLPDGGERWLIVHASGETRFTTTLAD